MAAKLGCLVPDNDVFAKSKDSEVKLELEDLDVVERCPKDRYVRVTQNIQSFSEAANRLEELSVSCKGEERVQLLKRWLFDLREFEKLNGSSVETYGKTSEDSHSLSDKNVTPGKPAMILYYDSDLGSVPMNFRDLFLQSQALEGMTTSMGIRALTIDKDNSPKWDPLIVGEVDNKKLDLVFQPFREGLELNIPENEEQRWAGKYEDSAYAGKLSCCFSRLLFCLKERNKMIYEILRWHGM